MSLAAAIDRPSCAVDQPIVVNDSAFHFTPKDICSLSSFCNFWRNSSARFPTMKYGRERTMMDEVEA